jgi:rubredoxin
MFRCKVCGWIHEGIAPPNSCPSCGAPADRFRPMDVAEIRSTTDELASYGIVGQGIDVDIDDTRRLRLLAFIDASFFSPYMERSGKRYPI